MCFLYTSVHTWYTCFHFCSKFFCKINWWISLLIIDLTLTIFLQLRLALWTCSNIVILGLRRYLVLHDVLHKNHSGMHTYFQRFPCLNQIFRIFFNMIFDGISAILLIKTSHNVTFLVIYKKIQEMLLI